MSTHRQRYSALLLLSFTTMQYTQTFGQKAGRARQFDASTNAVGTDQECFVASAAIPYGLGAKNRALSIAVGDADRSQAVRVRFVDLPPPFAIWNGSTVWAAPPEFRVEFTNGPNPATFFNVAGLACAPSFFTWWEVVGSCTQVCFSSVNSGGACSTDADCAPAVIHLFHEGIVPGATYEIQVIDSTCDVQNEAYYSAPLVIATSRWGDLTGGCSTRPCGAPDGSVAIIDVLADIFGFAGVASALIKARAEMEPSCPDFQINVSDILQVIRAFQGLSYPFTPSALDPCDSICTQPAKRK